VFNEYASIFHDESKKVAPSKKKYKPRVIFNSSFTLNVVERAKEKERGLL
jgi:hypothetical protein